MSESSASKFSILNQVLMTSTLAACWSVVAEHEQCVNSVAEKNSNGQQQQHVEELARQQCEKQMGALQHCLHDNAGQDNVMARLHARREAIDNAKCHTLAAAVKKCVIEHGSDPISSALNRSSNPPHPCSDIYYKELLCGAIERVRKLQPELFEDSKPMLTEVWKQFGLPGRL